jgi:hypothetical protein
LSVILNTVLRGLIQDKVEFRSKGLILNEIFLRKIKILLF